jgi:hypothetical protein
MISADLQRLLTSTHSLSTQLQIHRALYKKKKNENEWTEVVYEIEGIVVMISSQLTWVDMREFMRTIEDPLQHLLLLLLLFVGWDWVRRYLLKSLGI